MSIQFVFKDWNYVTHMQIGLHAFIDNHSLHIRFRATSKFLSHELWMLCTLHIYFGSQRIMSLACMQSWTSLRICKHMFKGQLIRGGFLQRSWKNWHLIHDTHNITVLITWTLNSRRGFGGINPPFHPSWHRDIN